MFHPLKAWDTNSMIKVKYQGQTNEQSQPDGIGTLIYNKADNQPFDGPCIMQDGKLVEALLFVSNNRSVFFVFDQDGKPYFTTAYIKN